MTRKCPHCGEDLIGEEGKRVCKNMHYEVDTTDPDSYRKKLSTQEKLRRMA